MNLRIIDVTAEWTQPRLSKRGDFVIPPRHWIKGKYYYVKLDDNSGHEIVKHRYLGECVNKYAHKIVTNPKKDCWT